MDKIKIKNIYAIYHLAGQSSGPRSASNPELDARLNIIGTINILNFASKNKIKLIFSSTFTVYGDPENKPVKCMKMTSLPKINVWNIQKML